MAAVLIACFVVSACAAAVPVEVEESSRSVGELVPDGRAGRPGAGGRDAGTTTGDLPVVEAPSSSIAWGDCERFEIPPEVLLETPGWECASLTTPMDPFAGSSEDSSRDVELALTRHRATGDRRGAILVNPGGPGGPGVPAAWALRSAMPADLLRSFDIVSWDPRGIGRSTPHIDCDDEPTRPDFIERCVELTGSLSAHLSAPYSAADMEAIRMALGESDLNYLGYSYGSVLGATYAAAHPEHVGAFVLDGVTDPTVGSPDGPFADGFPVFADDGRPQAQRRFEELCDATTRCLDGLGSAEIVDDLSRQVPAVSTDDYAGEPDVVDADAYAEFVQSVVTYAGNWELVATALEDADRGDASAMAALIAANESRGPDGAGDPDGDDDSDGPDGVTAFAEANFMIYCADLGPLFSGPSFCDALPENAQRIAPVDAVELLRPMLLIGTESDPLTPGYHAAEFAEALGDATHIIWEGVGHTAFPGWTPCIDDAVSAQFLRGSVPEDGARCSFLFGVDDDERLADELFGHGDLESSRILQRALEGRGAAIDGSCLAAALNEDSDQVISHVILDVTSDEADAAIEAAEANC